MAWIRTISDDDATGPLKDQYEAAIRRAGRVYNIVRSMSLNPAAMRDSMAMYRTIMFGPSPLPRYVREMIATVVSGCNTCYY
jgi:alkylhydroperoxidase family enzyme